MKIEFDRKKSKKTFQERGLAFEDVPLLIWERAVIQPDSRREYGEERMIAFVPDARIRLHVVGFTMRGDTFWIFSFRKANDREVKNYGEKTAHG